MRNASSALELQRTQFLASRSSEEPTVTCLALSFSSGMMWDVWGVDVFMCSLVKEDARFSMSRLLVMR